MATRALRTRQQAQVAPVDAAPAAPVKAPTRRVAAKKKVVEQAREEEQEREGEEDEESDVVSDMATGKENAAAGSAVATAPAAVPATPARSKPRPLDPCATPARPPAGMPATPAAAAAQSRRTVPATPAASASASPPAPLPPRPTSFVATDASLLRAMEVVFKKIDAVHMGFSPLHGPALDVSALYATLASGRSARDLGLVCHRVGLYLHRECKFGPAQQLHTMAAQYMRACKILPHQTAEMEYFALTSMAKQAALAPPATPAPFAAFRDAAEKLLQVCEAGATASGADPTQQFSFVRTALWLHYELSHTHVQRALVLVHAHLPEGALEQVGVARADWGRFMDRLGATLPPATAISTPAQQAQVSEVVVKVVDDLTMLIGASTMLARADGGVWSSLAREMLQQELRTCATLCGDNHLRRWRLAKLLQTPASGASDAERVKWRKELLSLPVSSSYAPASPSSKSSSSFCCASLPPMGVLLSLYEMAFVAPCLGLGAREGEAVQVALRSAVGKVRGDARCTDGDVRHAYGLYYLALSFLTAATTNPNTSASTSTSADATSSAARAIQSPLHASYRHSYQALKQFKSMLIRAEDDLSSSSTSSSSSSSSSSPSSSSSSPASLPRHHWSFLLDFMRCLYFRAVLAEHQGFHAQAQSLLENAMVSVDKLVYAHLQRGEQQALQQQEEGDTQQLSSAPYASILAGKLHRARVHSKLDRWDAVLELLRWTRLDEAEDGDLVAEWTGSAAPFLGPYALHAPQVLQLQRGARAASSSPEESGADSLTQELERMRLSDPSPLSCSQCALLPSPQSLPLLPCTMDSLVASLSADAPSAASSLSRFGRAELESLVHAHASWRHPPLMRLLHHRLASLCHDEEPAVAAFHLHQSLAITARHDVHDLLGEAMHTEGEPASSALAAHASSPAVAAAASCFALRSPGVEGRLFHDVFLSQLHQSWSVCTMDTDAAGCLWLSKVQPQHSDTPLNLSGQRLRVLVESCLLADLEPGDLAASCDSIHRAREHDSASDGNAAAATACLTWRIGGDATSRPDGAPSLSSISAAFAVSLQHGNEASALAKDFNTRVKPVLAGATAGGKKPSAKEVKEAKAAVASIDTRRAEADTGIAACCAQLQALLGPHLGALVGRWTEDEVEAGVVRAALALQSLLSSPQTTPQRLAAAVDQEVESLRTRLKSPSLLTGRARLPVVLLLGGGAGHLPWENLPALRAQPMTRMASWHFMRASMQAAGCVSGGATGSVEAAAPPALLPPVSQSDSYFVLNPQENLKSAESSLLSLLSVERGWRGSVGAPDLGGWSAALKRRAYFTYVGHNGGEEFVPAKSIRQMLRPPPVPSSSSSTGGAGSSPTAAAAASSSSSPSGSCSSSSSGVSSVALQIGCSSALQLVSKSGARPQYDPDGLSLAYQVALCPAMFGCLWNVTDDIDRWLTHVLHQLDEEEQRKAVSATTIASKKTRQPAKSSTPPASSSSSSLSLQQLSIAARDACKYNHLSGASIICYGLPIGC